MSFAAFANPVAGEIAPHGTPPQAGRFRVTATFGQLDADHPTPHGGVDIGNMRCGDPILACADGKVTFAATLPGGAKTVRIAHPQYPDLETGYAHLASISVKLGAVVRQGQPIGTLGRTGATACHLHLGLKLGAVSIDAWPWLYQNMEAEVLQGTILVRVTNRKAQTHAATNLRFDPSTVQPAAGLLPAGTVVQPDFAVKGQKIGDSERWYSVMLAPSGKMLRGYLHESTLTPLVAVELGDCTQQVDAARAAFRAKVQAALA